MNPTPERTGLGASGGHPSLLNGPVLPGRLSASWGDKIYTGGKCYLSLPILNTCTNLLLHVTPPRPHTTRKGLIIQGLRVIISKDRSTSGCPVIKEGAETKNAGGYAERGYFTPTLHALQG